MLEEEEESNADEDPDKRNDGKTWRNKAISKVPGTLSHGCSKTITTGMTQRMGVISTLQTVLWTPFKITLHYRWHRMNLLKCDL